VDPLALAVKTGSVGKKTQEQTPRTLDVVIFPSRGRGHVLDPNLTLSPQVSCCGPFLTSGNGGTSTRAIKAMIIKIVYVKIRSTTPEHYALINPERDYLIAAGDRDF
jgi:hypothetical protein